MKVFLEKGRTEREKEWVVQSVEEERIRGAETFTKESEKELFSEMLTPT